MHFAFVTSLVPDGKPTTGFEVANEAIVAGLRAIGHKVTVIGFRQPRQLDVEDPDTIILKTLAVENAGASFGQKLKWLAGALSSGLPVGGSKLRVVSWLRLKEALEGAGPFDGIIVNSVQMPTAFPQLLDFAPFIYIAHNVEYRSALQSSRSAQGAKERFLFARDARLLEPIERELCKYAKHVFVLSDDDKRVLDLEDAKASLLPLVFPAVKLPENTEVSHDVGLIGTWTWQPNFVGLKWFVDDVVPHLDRDLRIVIAGSTPEMDDYSGVTFAGRVASAEEFVAQSRVLALISRSGTGVQLKTIEAFQMGMPCVATSSSVRGIAGIPQNCRVEDEAKSFASALNQLVQEQRDGKAGMIDGSAFSATQRKGLQLALQRGLNSFGSTADVDGS